MQNTAKQAGALQGIKLNDDHIFHARWEYRGCTHSPQNLLHFRSIFKAKKMIYIIELDGSIKFYTERQGYLDVEEPLPTGYQELQP